MHRTALLLFLPLLLLAAVPAGAIDGNSIIISEPGLYTLDHDIAANETGVLINGSDVVLDGMGHRIVGTGANGSIGLLASGRTSTTEGEISTNVTVRNLTVSGWDTGIRIGEASNTTVEDVVAEQNGNGLGINPFTGITAGHTVRDSVFRNNTGEGAFRGDGLLLLYPAEGITVERCTITGNGRGIEALDLRGSTPNVIADCALTGNAGDGLISDTASFSEIRNCTINGNGDNGLEFHHAGSTISGNRIEDNTGTGVLASDRSSNQISGNRVAGNGIGIVAGSEWPSTIWNNVLNNTDNGFFPANALPNALNVTKTAGPNIVGGPFIGGNFWAFPNGTGFSQTHPDTNGDGFCDEPFVTVVDANETGATDFLPLALPNETPGPTPFKPLTIPGRIEAEDYDLGGEGVAYHDTTAGNEGGVYRHDDVDIEKMAGLETPNVGWIRNGEYLIYTVNVTTAGNYTLTARVASPNSGRTMALSIGGTTLATITVPNTGSFATFTDVGVPVVLPAGSQTMKLAFQGDGQNLDWFELTPAAPGGQTPFKPLFIPGTIQAEDYNLGGEGVAYHDTTPGNEGGAYRQDDVDIEKMAGLETPNVGWIRNGEYLTYTATVASDTTYTMTARVASPNSGRTFALSVDGAPVATIAVPNTGSFATFTTVSVPVPLEAGVHTLKLTFAGDGQNLDWTVFATGGTPPAEGASFIAVPTTAPHGSAFRFTVTPAAGKSISAAFWSFDAPAHLSTWNSRDINPTFFYFVPGVYSPQVRLTYTDGTTEEVRRVDYITST